MLSLPWIERDFHYAPFESISAQMQQWSSDRSHTPQLWFGEHQLVVSKGLRAHEESVPYWPSVKANRGGLLTIHGPGQLVFYPLWDLRLYLSLERYRWLLEETVIASLLSCGVRGESVFRIPSSPGVFTSKGKISAMGLRLHRNSVYHGISVNVACPLLPFQKIVCCGDPLQRATNILEFGVSPSMVRFKELMKQHFYHLIHQEVSHVVHDPSPR
jgi:lipoyl(octanoyl) transferase